MVLTDSKGEDKDNLCFLQTLRQMTAPTSQATIEFAPWTIIGSSKPSLFKFERKKQRSNIMVRQTKSILSP